MEGIIADCVMCEVNCQLSFFFVFVFFFSCTDGFDGTCKSVSSGVPERQAETNGVGWV